jgi:HD-GYP domain-containing protein (c-di-GMP phosphodiesterase class II)
LPAAAEEVSLSELVACLALATDLGMGQPLEHAFRTCILAMTVGESLGLTPEELAETYYICLLRFVGCNAHARQDALEVGDEIAFRAGVAPVLNGRTPEMLRFMVTKLGQNSPMPTRARMVGSALLAGPKGAKEQIAATCEVARMIALKLGMTPGVTAGLDYTFEHHDGTGYPKGAAGDEIPTPAHVVMVARDFEVLYRLGGREMVLEVTGKRRGKAYRPQVLDGFLSDAWEVLDTDSETSWDAVASAEPSRQVLTGERFEQALQCVADFSDIKSPYTHGYSRAVCELVTGAAGIAGMDDGQIGTLSAAALVQELGMAAVPSAVLDKPGRPTEGEWERLRLHPYFTERILKRCAGLASSGSLAGAHHERVDGTGYHRGSAGAQISPSARLLAAGGCETFGRGGEGDAGAGSFRRAGCRGGGCGPGSGRCAGRGSAAVVAGGADRPGGAGPEADQPGPIEPPDGRRSGDIAQDGRSTHREHLRQNGCLNAGGGHNVRTSERAGGCTGRPFVKFAPKRQKWGEHPMNPRPPKPDTDADR